MEDGLEPFVHEERLPPHHADARDDGPVRVEQRRGSVRVDPEGAEVLRLREERLRAGRYDQRLAADDLMTRRARERELDRGAGGCRDRQPQRPDRGHVGHLHGAHEPEVGAEDLASWVATASKNASPVTWLNPLDTTRCASSYCRCAVTSWTIAW